MQTASTRSARSRCYRHLVMNARCPCPIGGRALSKFGGCFTGGRDVGIGDAARRHVGNISLCYVELLDEWSEPDMPAEPPA